MLLVQRPFFLIWPLAVAACAQLLGDDFEVRDSATAGGGHTSTDGGGGTGGMPDGGGGVAEGGGGAPPLMCEPGTDDCNGMASDGCEAVLATDDANCGVCDHDCLGGGCTDSRCRALELSPGSGNESPRDIAVDAANVFWTNESIGNVEKVPIAGGTAVVIGFTQPFAYGITVDGQHLYWSRRSNNNGAIARVSLGGGAPVDIASNLGFPEGMANDATHIYWGSFSTGIRRMPKGGTTLEVLAETFSTPSRIALDADWVYFTQYQSGGVVRVRKDDSQVEILYSDAGGALGVAVDATAVYWVNFLSGRVYRVDIASQAETALALGTSPRDIVVDATHAYYSESGANRIMRVVKDGSAAAEVFAGGQNGPRGIAMDATAVYWVNLDGSVWKRAKDPP